MKPFPWRSCVVAYAVLVVTCSFCPAWFLLNFAGDDSLFYAVICNNFANGLGSTFDQLSPTNGYQPLWMLLLSGWLFVVNLFTDTLRLHPAPLLRIMIAFQLAFTLAALTVGIHLIRRLAPSASRWFIAGFILAFAWNVQNTLLMETSVALLIILAVLWVLVDQPRPRPWLLAALFSLLVLARLDQLFAVGLIGLVLAWRYGGTLSERVRAALVVVGVPALVTVAYLGINYWSYGHISTTASYAKAADTLLVHIGETFKAQLRISRPRTLMLVLSILATLPMLPVLRRFLPAPSWRALCLVFFAMVLVVAVDGAVLHGIRSWYLVFAAMLGYMIWTVIAASAADRRGETAKRIAGPVFCAAAAVVVGAYFWAALFKDQEERFAWNFFERVRNETPHDAIFYCYDVSGTASFVSQRRVIDGDGLVNSFEYIDQLKHECLTKYFESFRANYYLETRTPSKFKLSNHDLEAVFFGRHVFKLAERDLVFAETSPSNTYYALYHFDPKTHYTCIER